jgi:hypothetical protein
MLPIKHSKEPLDKGWEAHLTTFSMQHLGTFTVRLFPSVSPHKKVHKWTEILSERKFRQDRKKCSPFRRLVLGEPFSN